MDEERRVHLVKYITEAAEVAKEEGVYLEISTDFNDLTAVPARQPLRGPVAPAFDPAFFDIQPSSGFWLKGVDDRGVVVQTQAMRLVDLNGGDLRGHLRERLFDYRPHGDSVQAEGSQTYLSPQSAKIKGRVCYHGELWIKGGEDGYRGGCLTVVLPRLVFAVSQLALDADYTFGLMDPVAVFRGLAAREGYSHSEQGTVHWRQPESDEIMEEWLVWMGREDVDHMLAVRPRRLQELFRPLMRTRKPAQPAYAASTAA